MSLKVFLNLIDSKWRQLLKLLSQKINVQMDFFSIPHYFNTKGYKPAVGDPYVTTFVGKFSYPGIIFNIIKAHVFLRIYVKSVL